MTDLTLETTTGYIDAPELAVDGTASAQTATGAIDLGFSEAAVPLEGIEAHARNGAVTVALPREERLSAQDVAGYSVNASSSSGWTDVAVQQTAPGEGVVPVTVSSESGSVDVHDGSDDWDGAEPGDGSGGDGDRGDGDRDDQDRDDRDRDGQDRDRGDQDRDRQDQEQDRREQDQDRQDPDRAYGCGGTCATAPGDGRYEGEPLLRGADPRRSRARSSCARRPSPRGRAARPGARPR